MILGDGEQQIGIDRMDTEFVDGLTVTHEELLASLSHRTDQPNHATSATDGY